MLGLAIHTSSPQLGLMLQSVEPGEQAVKRHQVWDLGREVSSHLHTKLVAFMADATWQDLSFVAVAKGPGGFTGTRIGVVAARTLAQQLDIPLFGVSSLGVIAANTPHRSTQAIAVTMAAKREAVFGAIYRTDSTGDIEAARFDEVVPIADWDQIVAQWEQPLVQAAAAAGEGLAESVTGVMKVAIARYAKGNRPDWSSVMPFYGQHPVHR